MGNVTSAAVQGGTPMLVFSLSVAGVLIIGLIGLVGWLFRARLKAREQYENLLEKRLSDGAATMRALKDEIAQLSSNFLSQLGKAVTDSKFDSYCHAHDVEHNELDHRIDNLKDLNHELRESMASMRSTMDALNRILTSIVEIGKVKINPENPLNLPLSEGDKS